MIDERKPQYNKNTRILGLLEASRKVVTGTGIEETK
jgi:hypothetical protein